MLQNTRSHNSFHIYLFLYVLSLYFIIKTVKVVQPNQVQHMY